MKFLTVFLVLCLVAYSTQNIFYEGNCSEEQKAQRDAKSCIGMKCFTKEGTDLIAFAPCKTKCAVGQKRKGIKPGNAAAVYPDCYPTAICE